MRLMAVDINSHQLKPPFSGQIRGIFRYFRDVFRKKFAVVSLIRYICGMEQDKYIRELYFSDEFWLFYNALSDKVQTKFDYVLDIVRSEYIISTKFVKHLQNTDLYEMRVSVGTNEYRTVLFAINSESLILATRILVLNAFLKKSEKDYKKQIKIAEKILGGLSNEED